MTTSKHTFPSATIEVTPTMQALGDQPYRCRVYPDQLKNAFFQGIIVEASSREEAARAAAREFNALYPGAKPIEVPSEAETGVGLYSPTCEYCG